MSNHLSTTGVLKKATSVVLFSKHQHRENRPHLNVTFDAIFGVLPELGKKKQFVEKPRYQTDFFTPYHVHYSFFCTHSVISQGGK